MKECIQCHRLWAPKQNFKKRLFCSLRCCNQNEGQKDKFRAAHKLVNHSWMLGRKHSEETKRKMSDSHRGPKSSSWKGGLAFRKRKDERADSAYNELRRQVLLRDKRMCRLKDDTCSGHKVVHHILPWRDYPEERYNVINGITLCQIHHPRKAVDEQRLIPVLQILVGSDTKLR